MKRKISFLLLVCLFTLIGGGRVYRWTNVCHDSDGWLYEVDHRAIRKTSSGVLSFPVRVSKSGRAFQQVWALNLENHSLATDGDPPQPILPGSVASSVILHLKRESKLAEL